MTDQSAHPTLPADQQAVPCASNKPASGAEPAPALPVLVLAQAFFDPEVRTWRGEQPLWIVFWGYGVLANVGFAMLYALCLYLDRIGLQQALLLCVAGHTSWTLVALWRSSTGKLNTLWGALTRQLTVAWAVNAILVLGFLQLGLVERYLDASFAMQPGKSATYLSIDYNRDYNRSLLGGRHDDHKFGESDAP